VLCNTIMDCPIIYVFLGLPLLYFLFRRLFPENLPDEDGISSEKEESVNNKKSSEIVFENILSRRTISPKDCNGEAVTSQELMMILEAGNWAPTHQKTEPWRYAVYSGPEGIMDYLDYLEEHYNGIADTLDQQELTKFRSKLENARKVWVNQSSHVICIGMKRHEGKLPEWEEVSAVAMSVQNMHLMASALDIGGFWSSHTWARKCRDSPEYKQRVLGLEDEADRAFGAFVIGKVDAETKNKIRSARQSIESKVVFKNQSA